MSNITLNTGTGGAVMATEQNASAPNENYQIVELASGAGAAFANKLTITAAGAAKIDASGTTIQANAGTNLNTSALALESGGNLAAILSRLPATAALADATANPTLSAIQTYLMGYNGTTWDRLKSSTANGLQVDVTRVQGSVAVTGTFWQATQPVSGTVTANVGTTGGLALDATLTGGTAQSKITDGTNVASVKAASTAAVAADKALVVAVSPNNSVAVTGTFWQATQPVSGTVTANAGSGSFTVAQATAANLNATVTGTVNAAQSGTWTVQPGNTANTTAWLVTGTGGTFPATQSGTWTVQPGNTANTTPWLSTNVPPNNGTTGWSFNYQSALSSTKAQIKGSAGTFGGYVMLTNPNTTETYIQVFNKASASVTVGTTAPDFVLRLPGLASASGTGVAANLELSNGIAMSTGITVAATTTATGSTAPTNAVTATFLFL